MSNASDAVERVKKGVPDASLAGECLLSQGRDLVIAPTPLPRLLDPPSLDKVLFLHPVQRGIERCRVKRDGAARSVVDQSSQLVPMSIALLEQRQDQEFSAAALQLASKSIDAHMWARYISHNGVEERSGLSVQRSALTMWEFRDQLLDLRQVIEVVARIQADEMCDGFLAALGVHAVIRVQRRIDAA